MTLMVDVYCKGVKASRRVELAEGEELVVGRENEGLLLKKDQTLSRRHFILSHAGNAILIKHLSQTNPTMLATESSKDFKRVQGTQQALGTCRIIAGLHRFEATVEAHTSATVSGSSDSWIEQDESVFEFKGSDKKLPTSDPVKKRDNEDSTTKEKVAFSEKATFTFDDSAVVELERPPLRESPTIVQRDSETKPPLSKRRQEEPTPRRENSEQNRSPENARQKPAQGTTQETPPVEPASQPERDRKADKPDRFDEDFFD